MMYSKINCIHYADGSYKSPVIFIHGFPDSPHMFSSYFSKTEQVQPWLAGRSIYTFSFPNRHDNPHFPPLRTLMKGVIGMEFDTLLDELTQKSPTGKLIIVAHDWGATHTWRWARSKSVPAIEKLVALSVGSSFRYDIFEHGWGAFIWLYGLWFSAAWYLPFLRNLVSKTIVSQAGYGSETAADLWQDAYHYWDRPSLLITIFLQALFFLFYTPEYLNFPFPVLYMRTRQDRLASTGAFEQYVRSRTDCQICILEGLNHWFPEQHSEVVLREIRGFING